MREDRSGERRPDGSAWGWAADNGMPRIEEGAQVKRAWHLLVEYVRAVRRIRHLKKVGRRP